MKEQRKKRKSLLFRVAAISLLMAAAALFLSGLILFTLFYNRAMENVEEKLEGHIFVSAYQVERYQSIDWLMSYWREHYDEMEFTPQESLEAALEWWDAHMEFDRLNAAALTADEVMRLSEEKQRLFAEYCYMQIYFELVLNMDRADTDGIQCFSTEEGGAFVYFRTTEKEKVSSEYRIALGEAWDFAPKEHPVLAEFINDDSGLVSGIELSHSRENGTDYATIYTRIAHNGKFYGVVAESLNLKEMMDGVWSDVLSFASWIILGILSILGILLYLFYLSLLRPILKLEQDIRIYTKERSAGRLSEALESLTRRRDEIGSLAGEVEEMVRQNECYSRQQLENEKLKTRILMAQIKPHFIYNCLSLIRSFMDEPEKAEEVLNHFAGFLRGSMDVLEETGCIPAEREFETVDNYLYMEKQRFEDQLNVETDLQDRDFFLPAFSVQMLVENAVNHGIRRAKGGSGTVSVRSRKEDGFHVIEVEDDGAGIAPEKGEKSGAGDGLHIGLKNIENRLQRMCAGTLEIRSSPGEGTLAVIRIPSESSDPNPG